MKGTYFFLNGNQEQKVETIKFLKDNGKIKGGAFVNIIMKTKQPTYSTMKENIVEKQTESTIRLDMLYSNTKKFKDQHKELGTLKENERHINGYENLLIENTANGLTYLRAFTTDHKPNSQWLLNGQPTTKEELVANNICSEAMVKSKPFNAGIFQVKLENVIAIEIL